MCVSAKGKNNYNGIYNKQAGRPVPVRKVYVLLCVYALSCHPVHAKKFTTCTK